MILICGDSWGLGELETPKILHPGLAGYLREQGHLVVNVSRAAGSNWLSLYRMREFLTNGSISCMKQPLELILAIQTEWPRDYEIRQEIATPEGWINQVWCRDDYHAELHAQAMSRWYYALSDLAQEHRVRIGVIGGLSDTIWIDRFEQEYPGVFLACQSWVNLCLTGNHRTNDPVHWVGPTKLMIETFRRRSTGADALEVMLAHLEQAEQRVALMAAHPEWFYPDGSHPNRRAHLLITEFLGQQGILPKPTGSSR